MKRAHAPAGSPKPIKRVTNKRVKATRKPTIDELDRLMRYHKKWKFERHADAITSWGMPQLDIKPNDLREHIRFRKQGLHVAGPKKKVSKK